MNPERKAILSWALYDWANSAFATTVMAGFFPLFFKEYWSLGMSASESTYFLGISNSVSSLAVAIAAPVLGALADQGLGKKRFLAFFTLIGACATGALYFIGGGDMSRAAFLFALASFAFAAALVFYDALLIDVSTDQRMDLVSSFGYGLGYLGGGLLFTLNVIMYLKPEIFGLKSGVEGIKWSFLSVGIWWLLFSLPLFLWVKEKHKPKVRPPYKVIATQGWKSFIRTLKRIAKHKPLLLFLASYLLYIDGVNTIIKMAVDYGMAIGFSPKDLIAALLLVQFIGFPSAIGFGFVAQRLGARKGIFICLWVYGLITVFAFLMKESWHFYVLASAIGLVQGGVQALSRSIFARMIPAQEAGEYFGFFNLLGKFSAIIGPLLVGAVSLATGEPRWSILILLCLFVSGGWLLAKVDSNYRVPAGI